MYFNIDDVHVLFNLTYLGSWLNRFLTNIPYLLGKVYALLYFYIHMQPY